MLEQIFSSKIEKNKGVEHKVYTVCNCIRIKFKRKENSLLEKLEAQEKRIKSLEKELKLQRILIEKSIDITTVPKAKGGLRKL